MPSEETNSKLTSRAVANGDMEDEIVIENNATQEMNTKTLVATRTTNFPSVMQKHGATSELASRSFVLP